MPLQHALKFFVEDADLDDTLTQYVCQAVAGGQGGLVIAKPARWRTLAHRLSSNGLSGNATLTENAHVERLLERGQLVFVDAQEARKELMVKGEPSRARFQTHFTELIDRMNETWPGVHVFDETGDLLASDAQFGPMRQLERMWSDSRRDTSFGLLSAYCLESFNEPADEQPFDNLCNSRTQVFAAGDSGGAEVARWQRHTAVLNRRLEETQAELEQTRDELDLERERHHQRSEYLGKFAHELRNPMAPVLCAVEMMNLRGDATNQRERGIIERQVSRLVDMVDDFLDVTRVVFERTELQKSHVELGDVIRLATQMAQSAIEDRGQRLHLDVEDADVVVEADPDRLATSLAKMLENAAIYTPEGGNVWLETQREAGSVAISIRDDGPGIDASLLDKVFEMFIQGEAEACVEGRGMGTGLTIARKIAELHGGAVAAYSDKSGEESGGKKGSEFVMRLPLDD
jgi:signal transduction histidine kinase